MNKEEINEAIKLIKEPIIVNSIEYKYFNQENYEKLLRVYENCRWFIDNYEQVLQNIKILQQKLQRKDNIINELKKWLEDYIKLFDSPDILEEQTLEDLKEVLDKINELEGDNKWKKVDVCKLPKILY